MESFCLQRSRRSETLRVRFGGQHPWSMGAGFGAASGFAIQGLIRRRRLRKLGFTADDLSSKENFYKKLAEITVQKMPQEISFSEIRSHSWSKKGEYARSKASLERLGFEQHPIFVASPQTWVAEFWLSKTDGLFAAILDVPPCGMHTEITVTYKDRSTVSFENTEECGRQHLEQHTWIHCGRIAPDE